MIRSEKENHIARCLQIIEDKLGWGKAEDWSNYDFSKLSEEVLNKTQVRLSVTTLKRIWGKLKYDNAPALTTLNAVAMFAGYSDWRTYCNEQVLPGTDAVIEKQTPEEIKPLVRKINRYYLLMLLPLIAAALSMLVKTKPKIDPDKFEFWADKMVVEGVPNSVVFHYDAKAATSDSVFIVQTWDSRRKKRYRSLTTNIQPCTITRATFGRASS